MRIDSKDSFPSAHPQRRETQLPPQTPASRCRDAASSAPLDVERRTLGDGSEGRGGRVAVLASRVAKRKRRRSRCRKGPHWSALLPERRRRRCESLELARKVLPRDESASVALRLVVVVFARSRDVLPQSANATTLTLREGKVVFVLVVLVELVRRFIDESKPKGAASSLRARRTAQRRRVHNTPTPRAGVAGVRVGG